MTINFNSKVRSDRPAQTRAGALAFATESDRGRIINSAAVRRLQQKTQVFPLERNAAVRSRLTHSLEVQQTGRFIVQTIFRKLSDAQLQQYQLTTLERPAESLVEMACLLHDVGNPPFGHSGESAINKWFSAFLPALEKELQLPADSNEQRLWHQLATELAQFEGNAQAIRLVYSLLQLNLTYTQVACILKYTRPATETKPADTDPLCNLKKKPGYYFAEQAFIAQLQQTLQMQPYCRHPLSYTMEAADDISYCLADIEDAVEKGILNLEQLKKLLTETFNKLEPENRKLKGLYDKEQHFADIIEKALKELEHDDSVINKASEFFIKLRVGIIHPLVQYAAEQFIQHIDTIYHGNLNRALLEDNSQYHAVTRTFKQVAAKYVFNHREVELLELQGYRIIGGLLDVYKPLLTLPYSDFLAVLHEETRKFPVESRLLHKLSQKHLAAYKQATGKLPQDGTAAVLERYYRCRLLQDYISGMTDHFASDEYQALVLCKNE
ncbi:dGTPase [Chromatiaceae bacterium AAb-1]|nr:dGTPase [Chromatiaceae bacterium AAb-1]